MQKLTTKRHRDPSAVSTSARTSANDADADRERVAAIDQRIAALRLLAGQRGWRCEVVPGGFELSRWSRFRLFATLAEAEAFIAEVAR